MALMQDRKVTKYDMVTLCTYRDSLCSGVLYFITHLYVNTYHRLVPIF